MKIYDSCKASIAACMETRSFTAAHLYNNERTMAIHIHDCYEIYYSISGGKQFLIDNRFYDFQQGDIFFINQYESHYLSEVDNVTHERIILDITPDYLKSFCTRQTDLNYCFSYRGEGFSHKVSLSAEEQKRFLYFIHRLSKNEGFGSDVLDQAVFLELMTFLNAVFLKNCGKEPELEYHTAGKRLLTSESEQLTEERSGWYTQIDEILSYINQNLTEELSIRAIADSFYISPSYLCRIFREATGTTINKYITAKRIARAKVLLSEGHSVTDSCAMCGFRDYTNFLRAFTRAVGISPKKYAQFST